MYRRSIRWWPGLRSRRRSWRSASQAFRFLGVEGQREGRNADSLGVEGVFDPGAHLAFNAPLLHRYRLEHHPHHDAVLVETLDAPHLGRFEDDAPEVGVVVDRKSTRLNSSHVSISYAVFCLKKKKT